MKDLGSIIDKCAFFKSTTGLPHYDQFVKEGRAVIVYMNTEEYISECMHVHNYYNDMQSYIIKTIKPAKVRYFKELMIKGVKLPIPMIDYVLREQEGRHRMLAYKELVTILNPDTDKAPVAARKIL